MHSRTLRIWLGTAKLKLPGFFFSALAFISTAVGCSEYKEYHSRPDVKPRLVHEPLNAVENVRQAAGVIPGFADISWVEMNWNATQSTTNACYLHYAPATNVLQLSNDAGSSWIGSATLGVAGTLQNSQYVFFDPAKAALNIKTKLSVRLLPDPEADDAPASTLQYAFHGGYEPGVSSDLGLELGKPMTFQYAVSLWYYRVSSLQAAHRTASCDAKGTAHTARMA